MDENKKSSEYSGLEIAVIGMAGRFPGAKNIHELWDKLDKGIESISFFTLEELKRCGISPDELNHPDYVRAKGVLEETEYFDAPFFGYTPREAEIMTPQVRIFHECAWEALEDAAYDPDFYNGLIGVFAGAAQDFYWERLCVESGKFLEFTPLEAGLLSSKDPLGTRLSYKFNLKGPSFSLYTACSTSGVAIHQACQNLLAGECHMALAGAISIFFPPKTGFLYQEGMIISPDGHCRVFDAEAKGSVFGDGIGVVILKLLEEAVKDRDHIYAIIKGTALNNDGRMKVGFTAPSTEGQAAVMRAALHTAGIEVESITYIETHGTGTTIGDPIELEAMQMAYQTHKKNSIGIGSIKSNIGHLNTAAGMSGFIKTVLALKNRLIPPSLHFKHPNPKFDFENSPFYVVTQPEEWKNNGYPLRAALSNFGMGGTNFHAILEEAPGEIQDTEGTRGLSREYQLILFSAKTQSALARMTENLASHLKKNPRINLANAAYTLQVGRKTYKHRRMLVTSGAAEAVRALASPAKTSRHNTGKVYTVSSEERKRPVIFMFSGVGSQYVNMGLGLYQKEPIFRQEMDRCFEILRPVTGYDLKEILYPVKKETGARKEESILDNPVIAQLTVFALEYGLAQLMMAWGIKPDMMIGYSFGEYVAACIAGVFSLEDVLRLVVIRANLIQETPEGAMLSVPVPVEKLKKLADEHDNVSIAIDNGPATIVAGTVAAINAFEKKMKNRKYMCMRVAHSRALHSTEMDSILPAFAEQVRQVTLREPSIPYISNLTGKIVNGNDVTHIDYWVRHLKETVQFAAGIKELVKQPNSIFIEIGPGRDLSALVRRYIEDNPDQWVINLVRQHQQNITDTAYLLDRIGWLWLKGLNINWKGFYSHEKRRRIPLPPYPFERKRYWIEGNPFTMGDTPGQVQPGRAIRKNVNISSWFYAPVWKQMPPLPVQLNNGKTSNFPAGKNGYLVFTDSAGIGDWLAAELMAQNQDVVRVKKGSHFCKGSEGIYHINPCQNSDYEKLIADIGKTRKMPHQIIHLWSISRDRKNSEDGWTAESVVKAQDHGFYSLLYLVKTFQEEKISEPLQLVIITNNMQAVCSEDYLCPEQSTVLGPVNVIPQENPFIRCRTIDIPLSDSQTGEWKETQLLEQLLAELQTESPGHIIALRDNHRWLQTYESLPLEGLGNNNGGVNPRLRQEGVYLITGGLGGIGLVLAKYFAQHMKARLVLTGRSPFPSRDQWNQWLASHPHTDKTSARIQRIQEIEQLGGKVLVLNADVADENQMYPAVAQAEKVFGPIKGVIHAAGINSEQFFSPVAVIEKQQCEMHFKPKMWGLLTLQKILKNKKLDFVMVMSSISSVLGGLASAAYSAANIFMDNLIQQHNRQNALPWLVVNWDTWKLQGKNQQPANFGASMVEFSMSTEEGIEAFMRILAQVKGGQIILSVGDLQSRINQWITLVGLEQEEDPEGAACPTHSRENLSSAYTAPCTPVEKEIVDIWQNMFHFDQLGIDDDFFELGGDSLKAIIILTKIQKAMNIEIPLTEIFNKPTIAHIAEYINTNKEEKHSSLGIGPMEAKEYYVLSPSQRRLHVLQQLDKEDIVYNESQVVATEIFMDFQRLEEAFRKLIERHECYRTSFIMVDGELVQRINHASDVDFKIQWLASPGRTTDPYLSADTGENQDQERVGELIRSFIQPFDLSQVPLIRVGVIKTGEQQHTLVIDKHHIVNDGLSNQILIMELEDLYRKKELPPLRLQYKDYAEWLNCPQQQEAMEKQKSYWLRQFQDDVPVLNLPTDYPRPPFQGFAGNTLTFEVGEEETEALRERLTKEETTLFVLLLSLFYVLLSKLSSHEDIVVGTPVFGRRHADFQNIIGMFVNTLALRNVAGGEKRLSAFIQEVKANTLNALENQDYPFEKLVEQVDVTRDVSRNPLFDVMFVIMEVELPGFKLAGLPMSSYIHRNKISKFDLTLEAVEKVNKLRFTFEYNTSLFKPETIKRFTCYFEKIILSVLEDPERKISRIEIITEEEKTRILYDFNETTAEYLKNNTIHQLFEEQVGRTPDNIALMGTVPRAPGQLTYRELNQKSNQLAHLLQKKGVRPDNIVGIMVDRSLEMLVGIFAILKTGGAYLPIDPIYPGERMNYMLADSRAKILFTNRLLAEEGKKVRMGTWEGETIWITREDTESTDKEQLPTHSLTPSPTHLNLAYVIYTSGSTGKPKGVMIKHQAVHNFIKGITEKIDFVPGKTILALTTISFDIFVLETLLPLSQGLRIIIADEGHQIELHLLEELIIKSNLDMLQATPTRMQMFTESGRRISCLKNMKEIMIGGEPFPGKLLKDLIQLTSARIYNMYGPTETTVWSTVRDLSPGVSKEINIGQPIANTQISILDKNNNIQPVGLIGELYIGGDGLASGYLNRPELTSEKFLYSKFQIPINKSFCGGSRLQGGSFYKKSPLAARGKIYRTGDLARWLPDGNIELSGRIDHQVKIRGFRIELGEIETQLLSHPHVKETVVMAKEDQRGDKYLCAYFASDKKLEGITLKDSLSTKLPDYMIPSHFVRVDRIPLTPNGKIDRKALPEPEIIAADEYTAPGNMIEVKLVDIWEEVLGRNKIGVNDDFFRIGGDSIKAIQIAARMNLLGYKLEMRDIFRYSSISQLSPLVKKEEPTADQNQSKSSPIISYSSAREKRKRELTPSDLTHSQLSIENLEQIKKQYAYPIEDIYPCTPMQEGMLFHALYDHTTSANYLQETARLRSEIDIGVFKRSLNELLNRHQALRTVFAYEDFDRPIQVVFKEWQLDFSYQDIRQWGDGSDADKEKFIKEFKQKDQDRSFDLSRDALARFAVIQIDNATYETILSVHHILLDAWCMAILNSEFFEIYDSLLQNRPVHLPPVTPYRTYIQWLEKKDKEKTMEYWRNLLKGYNEPVGIPMKKTLTEGDEEYLREEFSFILTVEKTNALKELAAKEKVTLSVVFQTIWAILLGKYNGKRDVVFGLVVSGRPPEIKGIESMVGLFINSIPVRIGFQNSTKFCDLLLQVQATVVESEPHHYCSLADIQSQTSLKQNLFNHLLTFLNRIIGESFENGRMSHRGKTIKSEPAAEVLYTKTLVRSSYNFDLVIDLTDQVTILIRYNSNLYDSNFMRRLESHIQEVVDQVMKNSDIIMEDITLSHDRVVVNSNIPMEDNSDFEL